MLSGVGWVIVRVCLRHHRFHLGNRNGREEAHKQQEEREEQAKSTQQEQNLCLWYEVVPARNKCIAVQRRHGDDKSLKPHTNTDEGGDDGRLRPVRRRAGAAEGRAHRLQRRLPEDQVDLGPAVAPSAVPPRMLW